MSKAIAKAKAKKTSATLNSISAKDLLEFYVPEKIRRILEEIEKLALHAENESVRLKACQDIIDRMAGKPVQMIDHTTQGSKLHAGIIIDGSLKDDD